MLEASSGGLSVRVCRASCIGSRAEQQDVTEAVSGLDGVLLAVLADGMGGMLMGRECAEKAVESFVEAFAARQSAGVADSLRAAAARANEIVLGWADEHGAAEETGCTLAAAARKDGGMYWLAVGDSRVYIFRNGALTQLNEEHNLRTRLARSGGLGAGAEGCSYANLAALTSFVGIRNLTEVDFSSIPIELQAGDSVLLCSDGLYGSLDADEVCSALASGAENPAETLVSAVAEKGYARQDNASAVVVSVSAPSRRVFEDGATVRLGARRGGTGILAGAAKLLRLTR